MSDLRPLVWCETCRDEHAEDAPHFAYAIPDPFFGMEGSLRKLGDPEEVDGT